MRMINCLETPNTPGKCLTGGCLYEGRIQCRDCDMDGLYCDKCILQSHRRLPFHILEFWADTHFTRTTLQHLGLILHLNHSGEACPHVLSGSGIREVTIIDTNGVHLVSIGYCRCIGRPSFSEQLFQLRIFPASTINPKTGFTFRVLRQFHMLNHIAKTTPWDYAGTINRLTDNVNIQAVPVCFILYSKNDIYRVFKL